MTSTELIKKVWEHPTLWDRNDRTYRNKPMKERLWEKVASELNCSVKVIKIKWKSLRDRYAKEVKREQSGQPMNPDEKKWLYFDKLDFLKDTLCPRAVLPQLSSDDLKPHRLSTTNTDDIIEEDISMSHTTQDEDTSNPFNAFLKKSAASKDCKSRPDSPASSLTEIPPGYANFFEELATVIKQKQEDECDIFGKLVATKMRRIPETRRGQIENFMVKYLNDIIDRILIDECMIETPENGEIS